MNLFSKTIETKADHLGVFKKTIGDAIAVALKAGVPQDLVTRELEDHAAHFRRLEQSRIEARHYNTTPHFTAADYEKRARDEEHRAAEELRRQQAEYARSADERGREEARRRGEIL